jgi:hypothetical protein
MYNREKIMQTLRDIRDESLQFDPYIVVGQPRRDKQEIAAQTLNSHGLCHVDFMGYSWGFIDIDGEKVDVARNYIIEEVLKTKAKYLFFIGEDTVIPYDGFKRMHKTAEANPNSVIAGVYYVKCGDAMINVAENGYIKVADVEPGRLFEAWQTGMDAMLIPVDALRKMKDADPDLPFCCVANDIPEIPFIGEDNFFVHRLRKAGVKLLVDTNIQCLHMDLATGKYTAHPSVNINHYFTNVPITVPLTIEDKPYIDKRWTSRIPAGSGDASWIPGFDIPKLISDVENPIGVEIGTAEGYTTEYLLTMLPELRLTGVDPYQPYEDWNGDKNLNKETEYQAFQRRIARFGERYNHLLMTSDEAVEGFGNRLLDFVFVDGLHTYDQVLRDCQNWMPKVKWGGVLCGHDYNRIEDVRKAVNDFAASENLEIQFAHQDMWYIRKN